MSCCLTLMSSYCGLSARWFRWCFLFEFPCFVRVACYGGAHVRCACGTVSY